MISRRHPDSVATRKAIRADLGPKVALAFSCGKDSTAAWLALRAEGFEVVPVYKFLVPGLAFVERSLAYYEGVFGAKILRTPHPSLFRWLRESTYQAPERVAWVDELLTREPTHEETVAWALARGGHSTDLWIATGVRAADSPVRRVAVTKHGSINPKTRSFMAVWDWNKARVLDEIRTSGVKLPVDYKIWGRSFDGLDTRFLVPLASAYPEDYRRILEWFPLAELEVLRHGWRQARESQG